ncbi:MAG: hypothetical protein Q4G09_01125 [Clostridia bacterium]|nr:hypothetical protein [Clostridia bacterium]
MVSNPMQKKARNSFLLGMVITLIICAIIGVAFYFLIIRQEETKQEEEGVLTYAYRLNTNVKSGEEITTNMVESIIVTEKAVPTGAFASKTKRTDSKGKEEWINTPFPSGYKSKVNLNSGTILASNLVYEGEETTNDLRYVEYNMLTLPTTIAEGDYIDVRITLPNGQDLIIISKKQVKSLIGDTIGLQLSEGEILMMESAIVEAYIMKASKLYAIQYVEPGIQEAAIKTYSPTEAVQNLIKANSNITNEAKSALEARYINGLRSYIDNEKNIYVTEQQTNLETGIQQEIKNARAAREAYLSGLTSY